MNKKKKTANKKHRKTRQRLKQLKIVSLSKMKKKAAPKVATKNVVVEETAKKNSR